MKFKTIMLGTAALAVMAAPATAQDAPPPVKHHHRHHVVAGDSVAARIDELERQIQDLKSEEREHAQAQAAAAQAAPSDDQVSGAQFEALQNQVYEQQASTTALTKGSWWSNTKITGRFYWDVTNIDAKGNLKSLITSAIDPRGPQGALTTKGFVGNAFSTTASNVRSTHTKSPEDGLNYDLKRAYLIVDHKFNDTYSANLTTDATYDSSTGASQIFIKKAYLQAAYDPAFTIKVGAADLPWVPFVEGIYGYRYVENTLIDRTKFGTSSDWGAHVLGTFDLDGPKIGYQISALNGFGYKADPIGGGVNRSKGVDFEGRVNLNWYGFVAAVGGYVGKLGKDVQNSTAATCGVASGTPATTPVGPTCHTAKRFDALLAYTDDMFRVGVEYFSATNYKNTTNSETGSTSVLGVTPYGTNKANGYSGFASYKFDPQWSVFGRYDWVSPTDVRLGGTYITGVAPNTVAHVVEAGKQNNKYYNFGVSYSPISALDFALVYKHDSFQNGAFGDSNIATFTCYVPTTAANDHGHLTSAGGNCNQGTYNEIGIFGQVNF